MKFDCPKCKTRGWLPPPKSDSFPPVCPVCKGACRLGTIALCDLLEIERGDLYAVRDFKAGPIRGTRVLDAIARVFPTELTS